MKKLMMIFAVLSFMYSANESIDDTYTYGNKELKGLVLNNADIKSVDNKPILIIFEQNGCYYCKLLTKSITSNEKLQEYLKDNFTSYSVNISHDKRHKVGFLQLEGVTSKDFSRLYNLSATPLLVFIKPSGDVIMRIQGFPGEKVVQSALEYVSTNKWAVYKTEKDRLKGFMDYSGLSSK